MSALSTDVDVCNQALAQLGADPITALGDAQKEATLCADMYPWVRDAVLMEMEWRFAMTRYELPPLADTPAFGFSHLFAIPNDTLRVISVNDNKYPWRIEGDRILTNAGMAQVVAIARVSEVGAWSAAFAEIMIIRLAHELCIPLTKSRALAGQLYDTYMAKLRRAAASESQQGTSEALTGTWLTHARYRLGHTMGPTV
jgi:hypothetical protein